MDISIALIGLIRSDAFAARMLDHLASAYASALVTRRESAALRQYIESCPESIIEVNPLQNQ